MRRWPTEGCGSVPWCRRCTEIEPGKPLPYKAEFQQEFGVAVDAALKEWAEANTRFVRQQDLLRRDAAASLNAELVAFRRSLRAVLGTQHRDYQQLRIRGQMADPVVQAPAPEVAPTVVVPAVSAAGPVVAPIPAPAPAVSGMNGSNGAIKEVALA